MSAQRFISVHISDILANMDNTTANETLSNKVSRILQSYPVILQLLRFAAIGFLNTGLNFLIVNAVSKSLGINAGLNLGYVSVIGFTVATVQSYFWNRYWAFGGQALDLLKDFFRLVVVGFLGVLAVGLAILGSKLMAQAYFYALLLIIFFVVEFIFWKSFGFGSLKVSEEKNPFVLFLIVSVIGLLINATATSLVSSHFIVTQNPDLNKNIAIVIATGISLIWNFVGYKLIVFKK
jgi:putative flippase GtrA